MTHSAMVRALACLAIVTLGAGAFAGCLSPPVTPPPTTSDATIAANSAAWRYDYPGGLVHSVRGQYYLNVGVTVTNHGSIPLAVLAAEFAVLWEGETVGIPAIATTLSTTTIANGQSATTTVAFLSTELKTPVKIEFRQAGFVNSVSANVPAPTALPIEVMFSAVTAAWSANGTNNRTATSGQVFLWVNFTMMNHDTELVELADLYFEVVDANGTDYNADDLVGPANVIAGGSAAASVLFEVPEGFVPKTIHFDAVLGPWTDFPCPTPS